MTEENIVYHSPTAVMIHEASSRVISSEPRGGGHGDIYPLLIPSIIIPKKTPTVLGIPDASARD